MSATEMDLVAPPARNAGPSPRRVCLVTEAAGGGVGRHFLDLAAGLRDRGVDVVAIYSPGRCDASFRERIGGIDGVRFIELPMRRAVHPLDAVDVMRLARCMRKIGPFDLIHGHSSKGGALARMAARWLGIPSIYTPHALVTLDPTLPAPKRTIYGAVERWLARQTGAIIAVSEDEAEHARLLGIDPRRIHVVHNGVDRIDFPPRETARARWNLSSDDFCIGFVGRLTPQKAPELLVQALAALLQEQPNARLLIVGSGPLETAVREQVVQLGLEKHVQMLGDIVATQVMPAFDVFCLSSRYEGLPYVLLEALAAGLPIVATRVGGTSACVEQDGTGMIVESASSGALAAALGRIAADAMLRRRFGEASIATASKFTIDRMLDKTLDVYRQVLVAKHGRGSPR